MSRIGKKAIAIPAGVTVDVKGNFVKVTGPKGTLEMESVSGIDIKVDAEAKQVLVENPTPDKRQFKAMHGTVRSLVNNMVTGVSTGYERQMLIYGTGYNLKEQNGSIILSVGFCHTVDLPIPAGVTVEIKSPATRGNDVPASFALFGSDKQVLGQFAAIIRKVRPPEPYKGKGIRYADEVVRRKLGKAFASGG